MIDNTMINFCIGYVEDGRLVPISIANADIFYGNRGSAEANLKLAAARNSKRECRIFEIPISSEKNND